MISCAILPVVDAGELGDVIAARMPRDQRLAEVELLHQVAADVEPAVDNAGKRADGAAEFADQQAWPAGGEPLGMAQAFGEPGRDLEAEGHGQRLLPVRAPDHRGRAVIAGEAGEDGDQFAERPFDLDQRVTDLEDEAGVGHVLRGGAPVDVAAGAVLAEVRQLPDHGHQRVDGLVDAGLDRIGVEQLGAGLARDFGGGLGRHQPDPGLRPRQRRFVVQPALEALIVAPDPAHDLGAVEVLQEPGIDDVGRHANLSIGAAFRMISRIEHALQDKL